METQDVARSEPQSVQYRTPDVEVFEDDQALWVSADLPGVTAGDLEVTVDDGVLSLSGRIGDGSHAFRRRFTLTDPSRFDADHVDAVLRHGVLELRLPKAERAKRRQIPVTVN